MSNLNTAGSVDSVGRFHYDQIVRPTTDGMTELTTGDKLVIDGDREILYMPNGDRLTIKNDGSFELKTTGAVDAHTKGDTTTVNYPNGDSLLFSNRGVETVSRSNVIVDILSPAQSLLPRLRKVVQATESSGRGQQVAVDWLMPRFEQQAAR